MDRGEIQNYVNLFAKEEAKKNPDWFEFDYWKRYAQKWYENKYAELFDFLEDAPLSECNLFMTLCLQKSIELYEKKYGIQNGKYFLKVISDDMDEVKSNINETLKIFSKADVPYTEPTEDLLDAIRLLNSAKEKIDKWKAEKIEVITH